MASSRVRSFLRGALLPFRALGFLLSHGGVKRFAILPLLAAALFYLLMLGAYVWLLSGLELAAPAEWLAQWLGETAGGWVAGTLGILKWIVGLAVFVALAYVTFTMVGLVLASPLNDLLSERIEKVLCGPKAPLKLPFNRYARGTLLSLWDSLAIFLWQLFFSVLTLPFLLIPLLGFLPLFLVNAWFTGKGYFEVGTARNLLRPKHTWPAIRERYWELLGLGVAVELLFLVPFMGLLILPVGITAGTLLYCETDWDAVLKASGQETPLGFQAPKRKGDKD